MDLLFFAYADQQKDLPGIKKEADYHYSLLASGLANDHFKIHPDREASIASLSRFLTAFRQDVFLFHYSGHAGDNILELESGEKAYAGGVAHLLAQCPNLQLVILNGCSTAGQVRRLREAGVRATIIATSAPVGDRTAYRFSEVFYQALQSGESVRQAFQQGIGPALMTQKEVDLRGLVTPEEKADAAPLWGIYASDDLSPDRIFLPGSRSRKVTPLPAAGYFFGRQREWAEIVRRVEEETPAAIALTGGPGIGKSTLCLHVLHAPGVADRYGADRYFLSCDGAGNTDQVLVTLSNLLGVPAGPELEERIWAKLSRGRYLIAVDNAETPLAGDREAFEAFLVRLYGLDNITLLLTIRGRDLPFGLRWEKTYALKPLPTYDAKEVFLATAGGHFRDDPHLETIVRALDGLPLALVLLAGQAVGEDHLRPLLRRWEKMQTKLLRRGQGSTRLTNLERSLELTLQGKRVTGTGKDLFRLLSLLPDGLHRDELETLAPGYGEDGAWELVSSGLAGYNPNQRLQMLSPIRTFGEAYYPPAEEALRHLLDHYCALAESGEELGREKGGEVAERLSRELGNIEKAIALAYQLQPEKGIKAALGFGQFSLFTGLGNRVLLKDAHQKAKEEGNKALEANCLRSLGDIAFLESDNAQARSLFEEAMPLYDQIGSLLGKANCLSSLGKIAFRESDNAQARSLFEEAMPLYDQIGDLLGKANCLSSLGDIAFLESDNAQARSLFEEAMPLYDQIGDLLGKANCLSSLGDIAFRESDNAQARSLFEEAMPLYDQIGDLLGKANCLSSLGDIAFRESDNAQARSLFEEAMPLYDQIGSLLGKANCLSSLGDIAFLESDNAQARSLFEEAMPLYDQIGSLLGKANCLRSLGDIAFRESDNAQARSLFEEAMPLYDQIGSLLGKANCLRSLGDIAFRESDNAQARSLFEEAMPLYDQIGSLLGKANCFWSLGDMQKAEGDTAKAEATWIQALEMYRRIGDLYSMRVMCGKLATVTRGKEKKEYQKMEAELKRRLGER